MLNNKYFTCFICKKKKNDCQMMKLEKKIGQKNKDVDPC
jgi:hypothetical protein